MDITFFWKYHNAPNISSYAILCSLDEPNGTTKSVVLPTNPMDNISYVY